MARELLLFILLLRVLITIPQIRLGLAYMEFIGRRSLLFATRDTMYFYQSSVVGVLLS
jgi:hypothetical protein